MAATGHHTDPGHFIEHLAAECSQPLVVILAAAAQGIVLVIGDQHPACAEIVIHLHHAELIGQDAAAFQVEEDTEFAFGDGPFYVTGGFDQQVIIGVLFDPAPECSHHQQGIFPWDCIETHI